MTSSSGSGRMVSEEKDHEAGDEAEAGDAPGPGARRQAGRAALPGRIRRFRRHDGERGAGRAIPWNEQHDQHRIETEIARGYPQHRREASPAVEVSGKE